MNRKVIGARAKVSIEFDGGLEDLGKVLSKGLQIPDFWIKNDISPPYSPIAMSEAFGFESWLSQIKEENWNYEFEISTMNSPVETGTEYVHDLSEWLRHYIVDICELKAETRK